MMTPMMGNNPDLSKTRWAADTGCFSQPQAFTLPRYLDWLDAKPRDTNLFATAPDVVPDAEATWERSKGVLPQIRELGFNAALVAQNGIEHMSIRWESFDALFIGGTTEWKLSETVYLLGIEARARGKWLHWGRVNSLRRLRMARRAHANSADGTYIKYAPDLLAPRMRGWAEMVGRQGVL